MSLHELQRAFWRAVRHDPTPADALAHFIGDDRLDAAGRLDIYRKMYWYRQVEALAGTFERSREALGGERFTKLSCKYIHQQPSTHPMLEQLGHALPAFFAEHAPEVAELAQLEWARNAALLAPDPQGVCRPQDAEPEMFASARLRLVSSLQVIEVQGSVLRAFSDRGDAEPSGRVHVAVWRRDFRVRHLALGAPEAEALGRAQASDPVEHILGAFAADDAGIRAAFEMMQAWFSRQWIEEILT